MYPHRIRLRGPWDYEPLARAAGPAGTGADTADRPLPPGGKMTPPCRWSEGGLANFAGRVRFCRRFGIPRRIDVHERVWLTLAGVNGKADMLLNGEMLGHCPHESAAVEFAVTERLRERNELIVEVEATDVDAGLTGEVALEIRCPAYLRDVRLSATFSGENASLHVTGVVDGLSDQPLEIYVILDRFTAGYATVESGGKPFHIVSDELSPERWRTGETGSPVHEVRVELVCGGSAWYTWEERFEFKSQPGP